MSTQPGSRSSPSALERIWMWRRSERGSSPGERQIQPLASAKVKHGSLVICAGILGWPFSHAASRQNRGQVWGLGRESAEERRFHTSAVRAWALRITKTRDVEKSPWSVRISQNLGGSSSSPQKTCRSRPASGWAPRSSSTCWRRSFPSGHMQKLKPGRVVIGESDGLVPSGQNRCCKASMQRRTAISRMDLMADSSLAFS